MHLPSFRLTVAAGTAAAAAIAVGAPATAQTVYPLPAPSPLAVANGSLRDIGADLFEARTARRTKLSVTIDTAIPGTYSVVVFRRGTATKILTGTRTVKGTAVKPAKISLRITKAGQTYLRGLRRAGRTSTRADLRISVDPTAPGKTIARRRVITIGL